MISSKKKNVLLVSECPNRDIIFKTFDRTIESNYIDNIRRRFCYQDFIINQYKIAAVNFHSINKNGFLPCVRWLRLNFSFSIGHSICEEEKHFIHAIRSRNECFSVLCSSICNDSSRSSYFVWKNATFNIFQCY